MRRSGRSGMTRMITATTAIANRTRLIVSLMMCNRMLCRGIEFGTDAVGTKDVMTQLNFHGDVVHGMTTIAGTVVIL